MNGARANIPKKIDEDIKYNAAISEADVEHLDIPNDEFGMVFKRVHVLCAVGVLKE